MLPCASQSVPLLEASSGVRRCKMAPLGGRLSEKQTPETWIGRNVMVARASSTEAELVSLEGINDWGIVCCYKDAEVDEPVLIPWGAVSWVRLAVQQEVDVLDGGSGSSEE